MDDLQTLIWTILGGSAVLTIGLGLLCTLLSFLPFAAIGWLIWKRAKQARTERSASATWLPTAGHILTSRVEVSGGSHTTVSPHVTYEYLVGDQVYRGEQIRGGDRFMRATGSRMAYDTVERYPAGASVTVYYNPADPNQSALER